jgi:hypothetical protein
VNEESKAVVDKPHADQLPATLNRDTVIEPMLLQCSSRDIALRRRTPKKERPKAARSMSTPIFLGPRRRGPWSKSILRNEPNPGKTAPV